MGFIRLILQLSRFLRHIIFIIFIIKFHHIILLNLSSTGDIRETRGRISPIKSYTIYDITERDSLSNDNKWRIPVPLSFTQL